MTILSVVHILPGCFSFAAEKINFSMSFGTIMGSFTPEYLVSTSVGVHPLAAMGPI